MNQAQQIHFSRTKNQKDCNKAEVIAYNAKDAQSIHRLGICTGMYRSSEVLTNELNKAQLTRSLRT